MQVFQIRYSLVIILFISLLGSSILVSIPNSSAQESQIPSWIKNVSGWWAYDDISEKEFLTAIEYMMNNNIIPIVTLITIITVIFLQFPIIQFFVDV